MSGTSAKSELKVALGTMGYGEAHYEGVRVDNVPGVAAIVDVLQAHGHTELDTASSYTGGTSEKFVGKLGLTERGLSVSTKFYPGAALKHTREDLRKHLAKSLESLKVDKLDIFYLHAADRTTPFVETFKATDELYKEGKFARLGISNYMAWEVAEAVMTCRANGWVQPTVYQGIYSALHRAVEPELVPALRKYGIAFYEYNALGGGFVTGKHKRGAEAEKGTRFDTSKGSKQAQAYRSRYWHDPFFDAISHIDEVAKVHGLTMTEIALRWVSHHSIMKKELGDCVVIGASSPVQLEENLTDLEKGPLPPDIVKAVDEGWEVVRPLIVKYWH